MTIVGARPQFVKAAIVSHAFRQQTDLNEILVHTGQHFDDNMSKVFFDELNMPAIDFHLGISGNSHGKQTGEMIIAIEKLLIEKRPDWLLIYGDTNSTLAGALAAAKLHIPIAHVEAGLRSYNRKMPEEINRLVADQLAEVLFTPTLEAKSNLEAEGYPLSRIVDVGDVMYDAALFYSEKAAKRSTILQKLGYKKDHYILSTIHRPENTDNPEKLNIIFKALEKMTNAFPVVMPLHPRTKKMLAEFYPAVLQNSAVNFIEPVGFLDMIMLEKNACLIMTDSGGVQKEAFFYEVPCITLRQETEWVETIKLKWNTVVNPVEVDLIYQAAIDSINSKGISNQFPYGKGNATKKIVEYFA